MPHCCFGDCNSDTRRGRPGYDSTLKFFRFPQPCLSLRNNILEWTRLEEKAHINDCKKCTICWTWMSKCRRSDEKFTMVRQISKDTTICSKHFDEVPTVIDYEKHIPSSKQLSTSNLLRRRRMASRDQSIHTINAHEVNADADQMDCTDTDDIVGVQSLPCDLSTELLHSEEAFLAVQDGRKANKEVQVSTEMKDACTQTTWASSEGLEVANRITELESQVESLKNHIRELKKAEIIHPMSSFESDLMNSSDMCKFYTGMNVTQLNALKSFCAVDNIRYWGSETLLDFDNESNHTSKRRSRKLTQEQELLLLFLRLRGGLLIEDIAYRFSLSTSYISRVVTTWIQVLYEKFDNVRQFMFPSQKVIKKHLPSRFKRFKNIRVIIDCAEIRCETPASFEQQGNCYSDYKAHTTYKFLIGCTPNGVVSFVSDVMEGSIHDREIVEKSGLIDILEPGDLILADRGFTIKDLTDEKGVVLNIPAFIRGRDRLTPQEEVATKEIAANRIFVEHVVGRIKNFRIFQRTIPLTMTHVLSQMVFICACLLNFQEPLVA